MNDSDLKRSEMIYTACYCEENVWKLVEHLKINKKLDINDFYVVFISNKNKTVPIWFQKKCKSLDEPVVWDYHVIAIRKDIVNKKSFVYDLDAVLKFPETFEIYSVKALVQIPNIKDIFIRTYRVIPAHYYLDNFASDRSHMIDQKTGKYMMPPPYYECIKSLESENNINEFIGMENNNHGQVMDEKEFRKFFEFS